MGFEGIILWTSVLTSLRYPEQVLKSRFFKDARHGQNIINNVSNSLFPDFPWDPGCSFVWDPLLDLHLKPFLTAFWTKMSAKGAKRRPRGASGGGLFLGLFFGPTFESNLAPKGEGA